MVANQRQHLLRVREAAELAAVSDATIRRRIADGSLPCFRLGRGANAPIRITPKQLLEHYLVRQAPPPDMTEVVDVLREAP